MFLELTRNGNINGNHGMDMYIPCEQPKNNKEDKTGQSKQLYTPTDSIPRRSTPGDLLLRLLNYLFHIICNFIFDRLFIRFLRHRYLPLKIHIYSDSICTFLGARLFLSCSYRDSEAPISHIWFNKKRREGRSRRNS